MSHERTFSIAREDVDESAGEFRATLFTDGEATDGHILRIDGGRIPERMPLFVNHVADPRTQLGSLFPDGRDDHAIHVRGQIFVGGEGPESEIRRDLLAKMAAGHVSRMSGRWDADPSSVTPRSDLPKDHPAHVGKDARGAKRFGLLFREWDALEGSVVGLGADPQATLRWAEEAGEGAVAEFWRAQAESLPDPPQAAMASSFGADEDDLELTEERVVELIGGHLAEVQLADETRVEEIVRKVFAPYVARIESLEAGLEPVQATEKGPVLRAAETAPAHMTPAEMLRDYETRVREAYAEAAEHWKQQLARRFGGRR